MSAFTFVYSNGAARLPPTGGVTVTGFGFIAAAATVNATAQSSATPAQPYIDPPNNFLPVLAVGGYAATSSPPAPWPSQSGFFIAISGVWATAPFASVIVGAPFSTTFTVASASAVSTTAIPGCTLYMWILGGLPSSTGQTITIDFTGVVEPPDATGASIQYQNPTGLTGIFNQTTGQVTLNWGAAPDNGITQIFSASGNYLVDSTAFLVKVAGVGSGGGGASGIYDGGYIGGNVAGSGGAYAYGEFLINSLGGSVAVTVQPGGLGGAAQSTGVANYGVNGVATSFGGFLVANGGVAGTSSTRNNTQPGGIGNVIGGSNAVTETGGVGGQEGTDTIDDIPRAGGNTTNAGAGGGAGSRSGNSAGTPIPPVFNNAGGNSAVSAGGTAGSSSIIVGSGSGGIISTANPGNNGTSVGPFGGAGGGGGGYAFADTIGTGHTTANTGGGGNGGSPGAGGGGGGGGMAFDRGAGTTTNYGAGGNGGSGRLIATTFWVHSHPPQYLIFTNGTLIAVTPQGATSFTFTPPNPGTFTYTVVASYNGASSNSPPSNGFQISSPTPKSAGFNGDVWGPNGGSATPVNAPEPVLQALSYATVAANRITPQTQSQSTLSSQMSDTVIPGTFPVNNLP